MAIVLQALIVDDLPAHLLSSFMRREHASNTALPTAHANGLPPYVLKCAAPFSESAMSRVVTTAASGNPLPMPFAIVTTLCHAHSALMMHSCRTDIRLDTVRLEAPVVRAQTAETRLHLITDA